MVTIETSRVQINILHACDKLYKVFSSFKPKTGHSN